MSTADPGPQRPSTLAPREALDREEDLIRDGERIHLFIPPALRERSERVQAATT